MLTSKYNQNPQRLALRLPCVCCSYLQSVFEERAQSSMLTHHSAQEPTYAASSEELVVNASFSISTLAFLPISFSSLTRTTCFPVLYVAKVTRSVAFGDYSEVRL